MGYEVHVIRQTESGEETDITLEEWQRFVDANSELVPPPHGNTNHHVKNLYCLPTESPDSEMWPWIAWTNGRIHSKYCERPVMKKLGEMARYFGAVVMSDDGDIWTIDETGNISIDGY